MCLRAVSMRATEYKGKVKMNIDLRGKTAIVTGVSRGTGKTLAYAAASLIAIFLLQFTAGAKEPQLYFSSEPCMQSQHMQDNANNSATGNLVGRKEWVNKNELLVEGVVEENCAAEIINPDYKLDGDSLVLTYYAMGDKANCICMHPVAYRIKNLPKKEYEISIECEHRE